MISRKGLLASFIGLQTAKAQCGDNCGLYGGLASVATLNFNTKDCRLDDGTWIKLDCPNNPSSGALWELTSFSDAGGSCSYDKPIDVTSETHACENHILWDFDWTDTQQCNGQYIWQNHNYVWLPTLNCYTCSGSIAHEILQDDKDMKDIKVLCNSGDYLSLLSKSGNDDYTLVFLTTYPRDFSRDIPYTEGKYCTAIWVIIEYLRKDMQVDGAYDNLRSACSGAGVFGRSSSSLLGVCNTAFAMATALMIWAVTCSE